MNHPLPPETSDVPLAPGERLPRTQREKLSPEAIAKIQSIAAQFPDRMAGTLPALYIAQKEFGFLSLGAMKEVAAALGVPEGHVFGVATFYTMFRKKPVGRYHFEVCTNLCCALNGAADLLAKVIEKTGARPGEGPSPDGLWSVDEVECLASCGSGPCIQINHGVFDEFVDEAKLEALMDACRRGETAAWGE
ncbi:NADH-quinone oxidoreductase subunit NuoE family protein [Mesoterricola silvestris]|uniref:NADH-quinone oxidoreductase subunit E 2 n=1 Tax=Mesoterricola silvestris TaxID=2927979 RepID=A0AA48KA04_9BACT|nr:NAD(P)H-dependent oxidoreductase subunit E [Mesoterricola silvestris]BDU71033.1 NADH-quinone oxidoreductase subunit E 2 [Mesoterricola silvestris]